MGPKVYAQALGAHMCESTAYFLLASMLQMSSKGAEAQAGAGAEAGGESYAQYGGVPGGMGEAGGESYAEYGGVPGGMGNVERLLLFCPIRCSRVRACWWWGWG